MKFQAALLYFTILFQGITFGQKINRIYFDNHSRPLKDSTGAEYYISDRGTAIKSEVVSLYYPDGSLYATGKFTNPADYGSGRTGHWKHYYNKGELFTESFWKEGLRNGKMTSYRSDGTVYSVTDYRSNKMEGHTVYYYKNKNVKCDDIYENGKFISGTCFDSLGNQIAHFPVEVMPQYPGGYNEMRMFISNNFIYSKAMQKKKIAGKIYVSFKVNNTGQISDVAIVKGLNPLADEEALRIVKIMPAWMPGKMDGIPVNVLITIPIVIN